MIERLIEDIASGLGQWAYLLVAFMAMAETAAFLGFVAPGRVHDHLRRRARRRGHALDPAPDRHHVGVVRDRGRDRVLPRPPARARLRAPARPAGADHRGALPQGGGVLPKTRRQGRLHRPLGGPGPPADAVPGRRIGHELQAVRPLRHPGRGPVERHLVPARLHLLAELRAGGQHGRAGHDRVRDPARAVRRRLPGDQAPAASRAARGAGTLARPPDPAAAPAPAGLGRARGCGSRSARSGGTCCGRCGC